MEIVHRTAPRPREEITRNYELHELNGLLAAAVDFLSADCADYRDFGHLRSISDNRDNMTTTLTTLFFASAFGADNNHILAMFLSVEV